MGSPLKVKREKEFKPKFPSVGPASKINAGAVYENIGQRIPSLKEENVYDLDEEDINKMLLENTRSLQSGEALSFTASFASRIPSKSKKSPKKKSRK